MPANGDIARRAKRTLEAVHAVARLDDLRVPPSNQWRAVFRWLDGDAYDMAIVDYHSEDETMRASDCAPVTPGEILKEFLVEYGLSQNQLAKAIGISPNRFAEVVNNRRRITADTALRLALYFVDSPEFWLILQTEAMRIKRHRAA